MKKFLWYSFFGSVLLISSLEGNMQKIEWMIEHPWIYGSPPFDDYLNKIGISDMDPVERTALLQDFLVKASQQTEKRKKAQDHPLTGLMYGAGMVASLFIGLKTLDWSSSTRLTTTQRSVLPGSLTACAVLYFWWKALESQSKDDLYWRSLACENYFKDLLRAFEQNPAHKIKNSWW